MVIGKRNLAKLLTTQKSPKARTSTHFPQTILHSVRQVHLAPLILQRSHSKSKQTITNSRCNLSWAILLQESLPVRRSFHQRKGKWTLVQSESQVDAAILSRNLWIAEVTTKMPVERKRIAQSTNYLKSPPSRTLQPIQQTQ